MVVTFNSVRVLNTLVYGSKKSSGKSRPTIYFSI